MYLHRYVRLLCDTDSCFRFGSLTTPHAQNQASRATWRPSTAWNSTASENTTDYASSPRPDSGSISTGRPSASFYTRPPQPAWTVRSAVPYLFNEPGSRGYIDDHSGDRMMQVRVSLRPIPGLAAASEGKVKKAIREKAGVPEFRIVISREKWAKTFESGKFNRSDWLGDGVFVVRLPGKKGERILTPQARAREETRERETRERERREVIYQAQPRDDIEVPLTHEEQAQFSEDAAAERVGVEEAVPPPFPPGAMPYGYQQGHFGYVVPNGMVYPPEPVPTPPIGYSLAPPQSFYAPQQMYYPEPYLAPHQPKPQPPTFFMPARGRRVEIKAPTQGRTSNKQPPQALTEEAAPAPLPPQPPFPQPPPPPPPSSSPYMFAPSEPVAMPPGAYSYETGGAVYYSYAPVVPQGYYYSPYYAQPPPQPMLPPVTTAEYAWQDPSIVALGSPSKEAMMPLQNDYVSWPGPSTPVQAPNGEY
jgi:hypothetical protein